MAKAIYLCVAGLALVLSATPVRSDLGDIVGRYDYVVTGVAISDVDGERRLVAQCRGQAEGYANVIGTATFHGIDSGRSSGLAVWRAQGFQNGQVVNDTAVGAWTVTGPGQWRFRALSNVSNGEVFAGDGVLDTNEMTFTGALIEWD